LNCDEEAGSRETIELSFVAWLGNRHQLCCRSRAMGIYLDFNKHQHNHNRCSTSLTFTLFDAYWPRNEIETLKIDLKLATTSTY
jgi:hypothetical protein